MISQLISHENALIGTMLRHGEVFDRPDFPAPGAFTNDTNRAVVQACSRISARGDHIDAVTVHDFMRGLPAAVSVGDYLIGVPANVEYYIRQVKNLACMREVGKALAYWQDLPQHEPTDVLDDIIIRSKRIQSEYSDLADIKGEPSKATLEREFDGPDVEVVPTGFRRLDELLEGGFPLGGYVVGTGLTGHGKSTLAGQLVLNWCYNNRKVWFGSFEMAPARTAKTLMIQAGLSPIKENLGQFEEKCTKGNLYMSGTLGVLDPAAMAKEIAHFIAKGVQIFVIDNLTVMEALESGERYEKQVRLMQRILQMAMDHRVLFLVLAHLRKGVQGKPSVNDISGAGTIGQLAEAVWLINKPEKPDDPGARLHLLKSRTHGMGKSVRMGFNTHTRTYSEGG